MRGKSVAPGVEDLFGDIKLVIRDGIEDSFDHLTALRRIAWYADEVPDDSSTVGVPVLRETLKEALDGWDRDAEESPRRRAMAALFAWNKRGKHARALNGRGGLRAEAAKAFNVGPDRFFKAYETQVIREFAQHLVVWGEKPRPKRDTQISLTWGDVENVAHRIHREIDRDIRPDVVVTMAGPGSVAACYCMKVSSQDTPVLMCVTFPRRSKRTPAEANFDRAADAGRWQTVRTDKWVIYVPNVLLEYSAGSRILLLDDRVITGAAQRVLQELLKSDERKSFEVSRGALFAPAKMRGELDVIGRVIDGEFEMPWGTSRGRT